ncbi:MAG TPA: hypothetical protein VIX82_12410 [Solirubrobacteraceae bacterium]
MVSAILLLVSMFALKWYGIDALPGRTPKLSFSVDAWHGLSVGRWVLLTTIVVTLGSALLHVSQRGHGARTETGPVLATFGWLTAALLIYRVLVNLPAPSEIVDQKIGALVGLACGLGIALGASEALREELERERPAS